ncbi:DNA-3-methyladenine glycosylase I [Testudinibacter sp. TR-2022]|uniref:DNA-3-methyladenine glycosylase I n=1 Tax=Testudinibacter sp. TR-2022 TaxID=2585029 RepID=UPI00111961A2|nr:DNA-3-methyladenine glycosylase I [Testudinibacter sp. TR-2022]TNH05787.1 DNA-3-methyladenine glycosylase I [Pasteurellaceae bacterium Phil31]TNH06493.1 DNA-3-methyladenine glycosylase I [Pasteurellaceae bacterium Phil11]TNH08158.1 DNA-3-methyladenine glycosylase I [Testudinibacter sp. TR-2022]TNH10822.1 DNA-3-methyladenine glycosylase I [Testudinibacter sp. TR-2022]TNH16508.1 DNA-3-methyladenine glycosylase I [Testudinibacter sp. TR-2022]
MSYCDYVNQLTPEQDNLNKHYHDHHYGYPIESDNELFERLVLEINQAGLSWTLMLKKQQNFRRAYSQFDIASVAAYNEADRERLLNDAGIVRNKLKVNAAIHNAQQILLLQQQYGSFKNWLDQHHPRPLQDWVKLFKKQFKFVGGEIVNEFLMSSGYLPGAHQTDCPIYAQVLASKPAWMKSK